MFDHVTLSPTERQLRFTRFPGPRAKRIKNLDGIDFRALPRLMTKREAAHWLRAQQQYASADWRDAIERCLRGVGKGARPTVRSDESRLAEELDAVSKPLAEGAARQILVNAYERNAQARALCIEFYGTACVICGFDFGRTYGEEAAGYIHVHHLTPLASIGSTYEVDPVRDLRPVCPNCHAVIHLGRSVRDVETVQRMLQDASEPNEYEASK